MPHHFLYLNAKHYPRGEMHKHNRRISFANAANIEALLLPLLPDKQDRDFVLRCILQEGPEHHRGANYVLLALIGELAKNKSTTAPDKIPVPMRLPPHLSRADTDKNYPISIPTRVIERLAPKGSREFDDIVDCITDGPPQHALANVVMLCLLDAALEGA
jgi:hypothetical protein